MWTCLNWVLCDITDGPDSMTIVGPDSVHVGDFTMLHCSTMSVPSATFTWLLNGNPANVHAAVHVIPSSRRSNSGEYTCTAVNSATGQSQTVHHKLTVLGMLNNKGKQMKWNIYINTTRYISLCEGCLLKENVNNLESTFIYTCIFV